MTRRSDDLQKPNTFDKEETGGRYDLRVPCKRIADPRLRRLVLARIDALISARASKTS